MNDVTTVLFDVGNTLRHLDHACIAEVISCHSHAVEAAHVTEMEHHGKAAVDAEFRARRIGNDTTRQQPYFDAILAALQVSDALRPAIIAALREEDARETIWRVVHDDTVEVLTTLAARGYTLGVVSNADGRVAAALAGCGLGAHFRVIVDSGVVGVEKPDARIFQLALEACGAEPQQTLYIGDIYEIDVQGARNAGITPLLLDPLGRYATADCDRIDRLSRLLDLLPARL